MPISSSLSYLALLAVVIVPVPAVRWREDTEDDPTTLVQRNCSGNESGHEELHRTFGYKALNLSTPFDPGGKTDDDEEKEQKAAEKDAKETSAESDDENPRYKQVRWLGKGQFGNVIEVMDVKTGKKYARKTISKDKISACEREVALQKSVQAVQPNDHVVKIVSDHIDKKGDWEILMECLPDRELYPRIRRGVGLQPPYDARLTFIQLVDGLKGIHKANVVHRDLKPENIVCDESTDPPTVKITDFGLATTFKPGEYSLLDHPGSAPFASPEIWIASSSKVPYIGPEVDVWSLGVVLYVMLVGNYPFKASLGLIHMVSLIKNEHFAAMPDTVPKAAQDLLERMLDKNPRTRITLDEVSEHPWVTGAKSRGSTLYATPLLGLCLYFLCCW